MLKFY
jgi:hypothetical protein